MENLENHENHRVSSQDQGWFLVCGLTVTPLPCKFGLALVFMLYSLPEFFSTPRDLNFEQKCEKLKSQNVEQKIENKIETI